MLISSTGKKESIIPKKMKIESWNIYAVVKGVDAQDCWTVATEFVAGVGTGAGVLPRTLNGEGVRLR